MMNFLHFKVTFKLYLVFSNFKEDVFKASGYYYTQQTSVDSPDAKIEARTS